jgi:tetratricopeptide (TPR) repeat protein
MEPFSTTNPGIDPCLQIQVDLSAMLDGELDAASVRRVMVHSDVCESCRNFLAGIRSQVQLHRELAGAGLLDGGVLDGGARQPAASQGAAKPAAASGSLASGSLASGTPALGPVRAATLRRQLTENRRRLSRILYELGRGFVLMGLSPEFSREVAKEPVPVPDMAMRGRNLLDEVARLDAAAGLVPAAQDAAVAGAEAAAPGGSASGGAANWVCAEDLLDGRLASPEENLAKGQRLLAEALMLEPAIHEARIYLGLVHHVRGQRSLARRQFGLVLAATEDPVMRGYALLSLGTLHLDEGDHDGAVALLRQVIDSGLVAEQPRLGMAYFNLGLAYGLKGEFGSALLWFRRLDEELPHRRNAIRREIDRRHQFLQLLNDQPEVHESFSRSLPHWFDRNLTRPSCRQSG